MNITIKNEQELNYMRYAGRVLGGALSMLKDMIKPGVNCLDLDKAFVEFITKYKCTSNFKGYLGYPSSTCISINEQLIHTIPANYLIKSGDIVSIDAGCIYNKLHVDAAFSIICGDSKDPEYQRLLSTTEKSLYLAIEQIKQGIKIGVLSSTIEKYVKEQGYFLPKEFCGHGIGRKMHEDPLIPNCGLSSDQGRKLVENMTICIEPMVQIGTSEIEILKDRWTVVSKNKKMTAHFEHTILVKKDGYEILTKIQPMED